MRKNQISNAILAVFSIACCHVSADETLKSNTPKRIKFSFDHGVISVSAGFQPAELGLFFVDSGSSWNAVDLRFATSLVRLSSDAEALSANGTITFPQFAPAVITIASGDQSRPLTIQSSEPVIGLHFRMLEELIGQTCKGLIGDRFFHDQVVQIDYVTNEILIGELSCFDLSNATEIPLVICKPGRYEIRADIAGINELWMIDTGSTGALTLRKNTFAKLAASGIITANRVMKAFGVTGVQDSREGRFKKFSVSRPLLRPTTSVSHGDFNLIGNAFLSRYTVTFDAANRRIFLEPNQHFSDPEVFDRSGLRLLCHNEAIQINNIEKSSPAQLANLQIGDQIVKLNDRVLQAKDICWLRRQLRRSAESPTEVVNLTILRSGREFTQRVKLVDFTKWQKDPSE